jgi:branched-chain amino acid transport system substrate-binding protein
MIRLTRSWRAAAAVAAAALVLSACGGDDGGEEPEGQESPTAAEGDGTLTLGTLLPSTGDLAFLGPPEFAGVDLAVQEINEAGGVLGKDVKQVVGDSGDGTPNIAPGETDKLLDAGSDAILGAASSSVTLSVTDKIIAAGSVQFSPAATSPDLDTFEDDGMLFRTSPSDILQGTVMANMVLADGSQNTAIMARQDAYGQALADVVEEVATEQGGNVVAKELYDANAATFSAEVSAIAATNPDALVLISFNEATKIVPELIRAGIGPQDIQIYFVDGNCSDWSKSFQPGTLKGIKCTFPGSDPGDFTERLLSVNPDLKDFIYGPESYDATVVIALAAIAADSDAGEALAKEIIGVTRDGEKCETFSDCAQLLEEGTDIDYDGISGPIDMNETGSPSAASIGIFRYEANNKPVNVDYLAGEI